MEAPSSFVHVGMEAPRGNDFSVKVNQEEFAKNLKPIPTSLGLRAARQRTLPLEASKLRQCNLGELFWLAAISRPETRSRPARIAYRANSLQGSNVYRTEDLVETAKVWRQATTLKYASSPHPGLRRAGALVAECASGEKRCIVKLRL